MALRRHYILIGRENKPEKDGTGATKPKRKEYRNKVLVLNDILTNTLDDGTRVRLAHLKRPQVKWAAPKSFAVGLFKRREFLNVEFDPRNESIRDYIHRVEAIRQELTLVHEEVSDREVVTALLTGLGDTYESMVEIFDNLDDISLQQVKIKLTSREERLNQAKAVKETKARKKASFQAGNGGAQLGGSLSEEKNVSLVNKRKWSRGGGRGQPKRPRSEIYCHNCGKLGHYAHEYRRQRKETGKEEDVDFVDTELTKRFKLKCLGDVNYLLGLQIHYDSETHVLFRQTKYIQDIMAKFNMESAYPVRIPMTVDGVKLTNASSEEQEKSGRLPYRSLVGFSKWIPARIGYVQILSKCLDKYAVTHWRAAKRVLRHLIGTQDMGLQFDFKEARQFDKLKIEVYTDANFASEGGDIKSVTGFTAFCNGQLISAKCWKQNTLAESTCEAANTGIHEAIWLEQLVDELGLKRERLQHYTVTLVALVS
ncbi:Reverse transcriptase (RNA-dependent DNA polymerase) [Phytophthora infestans]|uniref:Reverse transcriptase (RNA-dependent DNA polymerase) n=1 Tax=Phytophthora infestans TaxID=4787 RepID=A0A833SL46_PHYIN|nr:Reverse transcriptase (RNA-dependent DNA polymerase) [Phytophthora infestans]